MDQSNNNAVSVVFKLLSNSEMKPDQTWWTGLPLPLKLIIDTKKKQPRIETVFLLLPYQWPVLKRCRLTLGYIYLIFFFEIATDTF